MDINYSERADRICMACGQKDKSPRDQIALPDGNTALYHMDCHAMLGCGVCQAVVDTVAGGVGPKGKKNEDLLAAIVNNGDKAIFTTDDAVKMGNQ